MRNSRAWKLSTVGLLLALLVVSAAASFAVANAVAPPPKALSAVGSRRPLPGHLIPALKHARPVAGAKRPSSLTLSIGLKLRNRAALDALLAAQNTPNSPQFHRYLTPQQFRDRFAPTTSDVNAVVQYLRKQGLTVKSVASNRLLITASGSIAAVSRAFAIQIAGYSLHGRSVYAPTGEPSVPSAVPDIITSVGGLDNVGAYHPIGLAARGLANGPHVARAAQVPATGPAGGYTPSELRTAYDVNSLVGSYDGTGQTVAIFELDGYNAGDVNNYLSYYGLGSAKYSNVLVDGATGSAGAGAIEVELDMEVVSAIAPGATQKIYIGPNSWAGVNDTYNRIVTDNVAKVTSTSWGLCEPYTGSAQLDALDNIFTEGAAQGQAFFAASGDSGAYDCQTTDLAVDSPADDPHVVGVGGTHLTTGGGGSYSSESVWSCSTCSGRGPNGTGGGGGFSDYFDRPVYQTGSGVNASASRQVPDVSADADPNNGSGYSIYCTVSAAGCPAGGWLIVGGTSAAAPLWAGIAVLTNHYLSANGKPVLGNASPTIYYLFNNSQSYTAYHDVTSGNNLYYSAGSGYDVASGVGTPDAWNFARDAANILSGGAPSISGFSPGYGATGTTVTITGSHFIGASAVTFNGTAASFTVDATTQITATVPAGATSGPIAITSGAGVGTSSSSFTVLTLADLNRRLIVNGSFEGIDSMSGSLAGWVAGGTTGIDTTTHVGKASALVGSTHPTSGDSSISQTFTVASSATSLTFYYRVSCKGTVSFDWATATIYDVPTGVTTTILPHTCTNTGTWVLASADLTSLVGHTVTLTLTNHDDGSAADPTYTRFDDVALKPAVTNPIVNSSFEGSTLDKKAGDVRGWTRTGAGGMGYPGYTGGWAAAVGWVTPTNGDNTLSQTFTMPAGANTLSLWYLVVCPDTITFDWATATLHDNTANTTTTVFAPTCTYNGTWVPASISVVGMRGHSVTLKLIDHDDNNPGDATYTFFDDAVVS